MTESVGNTLSVSSAVDSRFGIVAGSYVAALVAPALTLVAVERFRLDSAALALGVLGALSVFLCLAVARFVTGSGHIAAWLDSGWLPWALPLAGVVPMVEYHFSAFLFLATSVTDFEPRTPATLVGATGFALGLVACLLGEVLVVMARNRVAAVAVDEAAVTMEWSAAWPRPTRLRARLAIGLPGLAVVGAIALWSSVSTVTVTAPAVLTVVFVTDSALGDRTYRLTPSGLERRRAGRVLDARQFLPWSALIGFSVTDRAVVVHRPGRLPDPRCARRDLGPDEDAVVAALDAHLDGRRS